MTRVAVSFTTTTPVQISIDDNQLLISYIPIIRYQSFCTKLIANKGPSNFPRLPKNDLRRFLREPTSIEVYESFRKSSKQLQNKDVNLV